MTAIKEPDMLVVEFAGYGLMRIPTDPDPTDETRGVSGYTFAFGNEPDLDRAIYLQPPANYIRTHSPDPMGVFVTSASRRSAQPGTPDKPLPALAGAKMNWEDSPKLENRNLILTVAGMEPIVPFKMRIWNDQVNIFRQALINPEDPGQKVYKASSGDLARMAAFGMVPEPDTVRRATGLSDPYKRTLERIALLEKDKQALEAQPKSQKNEDLLAVIDGRLAQLRIGQNDPTNRRVGSAVMVERFGFGMDGCEAVVVDTGNVLDGTLNTAAFGPGGAPDPSGWQIAFWIGGWDADLLCAYFQGTLLAPYAT